MNIYQTILMYVVWFLSTYYVILFILLIYKYKDSIFEKKLKKLKEFSKVSILVPAFNEQKTILKTLRSLERIDYPKKLFEVIVINDGSTDKTSKLVNKYKKTTSINLTFIDDKKNKGKAARLNQGISIAKGNLIACMDADTMVKPDILKKVIKHFSSKKIGAVTVAIDVNTNNLLQKILAIEYTIGISLSIGILAKLGTVHVTPGPFTIFRKSMLEEIGGFDEKSITEDMEIAYRIHKHGYEIKSCLDAKVITEVPLNIKGLFRQRKRWYTGALQTLYQHRDVMFKKELGIFGYFVPYTYSLILLGLFLFILSAIITLYNQYRSISFYRFTGFNFLQHLFDFEFNLLSIFNIFSLLILFSFILTATLTLISMRTFKKSIRKNLFAYLGFLPFFIFYQVFWTVSLYSFVFNRRIRWR